MTTEPKATAPNEASPLSPPEMLERAYEGFRHYEEARYPQARAIFEHLAALDPAEGYYRTALGAVALAEEDLEPALRHFDAALQMNDMDSAALVNRGEVHLRLGNIMEAVTDLARAVELDPYDKEPLTQRARLLAAAALESIEAAQREAGILPSAGK
ncbi:type III secretion protein [Myxococcaceae bacterium GXIMD 01537]